MIDALAAPTGLRWTMAPFVGRDGGIGNVAAPPPDLFATDRLSDDDRLRLGHLTHAGRRAAFVAGRVMARWLVAPDEPVELTIAPGGCPMLPGRELRLGIAHSPTCIAAAVGPQRWVGIDLEPHRPVHPRLAARICRDDERPLLDRSGLAPDRSILLLWTLKEAVLKALGLGLRVSPTAVRLIEITENARTGRLDLPGLDPSAAPFEVASLLLPDHILSLAWRD